MRNRCVYENSVPWYTHDLAACRVTISTANMAVVSAIDSAKTITKAWPIRKKSLLRQFRNTEDSSTDVDDDTG